jgi:hypothetical protein
LATTAGAYHDGDLIYGGIDGQIQIVIPTDIQQNPPVYNMLYIPPQGPDPGLYLRDQGFDWFDLPETKYGIRHVAEATLVCTFISEGIQVTDGSFTYFTPGADRPTYRFQGSGRHKHFAFYTLCLSDNQVFEFRFKLVDAVDVFNNPMADSPEYSVFYRTPVRPHTLPTAYQLLWGTQLSGSLPDLFESDNSRVEIREAPPISLGSHSVAIRIDGTAPTRNLRALQLHLELSTSAVPASSIQVRVDMWNYSTNQYEQVQALTGTSTDFAYRICVGTNPERFVSQADNSMRMRIRWFDPGTLFSFGWRVRIDQATWTATPN